MPDGKEIVLIYLKLMVESIDHEGALRYSDEIPYTAEMLAILTQTESGMMEKAMRVLSEYRLLIAEEDKTLFFPAVAKLIGSETYATKRQRELRESHRKNNAVACLSPVCRQEKEIEIESESELETETEIETETDCTVPNGTVCRTKDVRRVVQAWNSLGLQRVLSVTPDSNRGKMLRSRVMEYGVEGVLSAIENVRSNAFLKGQNAKGWGIIPDLSRKLKKGRSVF